MTAQATDLDAVLDRCQEAVVELRPEGDMLRYRGSNDSLADELTAAVRVNKPGLMSRLRERAERRRAIAAWEASERLAAVYRQAGSPRKWMTSGVAMAEAAVEWHWLEARRTDDDERFVAALQEWERIRRRCHSLPQSCSRAYSTPRRPTAAACATREGRHAHPLGAGPMTRGDGWGGL